MNSVPVYSTVLSVLACLIPPYALRLTRVFGTKRELESQVQERTAQLDSANDGLQREISLRKQGEQELRKSKDGYRFLFDENPLPMWIFDLRSLRFLAFNNAALRHYGFSRAEFKELTPADLCVPAELDGFLADCARNTVIGQPRRVWRHRRKDGSITEVEITAHDLTYAECPARLVLAYDVSNWRQRAQLSLQPQEAPQAA